MIKTVSNLKALLETILLIIVVSFILGCGAAAFLTPLILVTKYIFST